MVKFTKNEYTTRRRAATGFNHLFEKAREYGMDAEGLIDMLLDEHAERSEMFSRMRDSCIHAGKYTGALYAEAVLLANEVVRDERGRE